MLLAFGWRIPDTALMDRTEMIAGLRILPPQVKVEGGAALFLFGLILHDEARRAF